MTTNPQQPPVDQSPPAMDVILYNAPISYQGYYQILELCRTAKNEHVMLLLTTQGGDPHAAYRIARCLRETYKHFTAFITSYCKSAGTLVVLGANEIVIGDSGELGPLDIQIRKKDELGEQWSGNDLTHGLVHGMQHALQAYRETFIDICMGAGLSAAISADASAKLVTGLFSRIFEQIDPSRLGEVQRANQISLAYGSRLIDEANGMGEDALHRLVLEYPSHGFVIDRAEAEELFSNVRAPTAAEQAVANGLLDLLREPRGTLLDRPSGLVKRIFPLDQAPDGTDHASPEQEPVAPSPGIDGGGPCDGPSQGPGAGTVDRGGDLERGQGNGSAQDLTTPGFFVPS